MQAAVYNKYGPPEVVSIQDIPKPVPKENEILVKVFYSSVNRTDCGFRSAQYFISRFFSGLIAPKYPALGCEFSGVVEQIGGDVKLFNPGDAVFGFNDENFGGHAEYLVIKEKAAVVKKPGTIAMEIAAIITEGGHYALSAIRAAKVQSSQKVMINGGTGAIGSAAIQLCKYFGADVTATCRTEHIALIKSIGADSVIDYNQEDFTKQNQQFDFVFDAVGKSTFGKCKPILKPKGIYISTELGPGMQNPFLALVAPLATGKKLLFPIPFSKKEDMEFLGKLTAEGKFNPLHDRTYSLYEIVDAYKYVETGQKKGNVLIHVYSEL